MRFPEKLGILGKMVRVPAVESVYTVNGTVFNRKERKVGAKDAKGD